VLSSLLSKRYPSYDFDLRATHARTLLPVALASVSDRSVIVRVRVVAQTLLSVKWGVMLSPRPIGTEHNN
jgi:hypothetical protein